MLTRSQATIGEIKRETQGPAFLDRLARTIVTTAFSRIQRGRLTVATDGEIESFGSTTGDCQLDVTLRIRDSRAWRAIAFGGTVGAGESYGRGWWSASDLIELIRVIIDNEAAMMALDSGWGRIMSPINRLRHWLSRNTRAGSRRNIAAHYDIGNDFYRLWLDETMAYSSGVFERPESTLSEASVAKFDRICRKLRLSPADRVIEIGTGWGGFAIHAAREYGCHVTTSTISRAQYQSACERVTAAGLTDRVTVLSKDYRDLEGVFDKLVSIEMIEAIGWQQFDTFFGKCASLLAPQGEACIQAIVIGDRHYEAAKRDVDFIKRHIFPGSCIPSIGALARSIATSSDLTMSHLEQFGTHYARTLRCWRDRLNAHSDEARRLGLSEEFLRLWEFYLCYCEGGFAERRLDVVQMLLKKPRNTTPALLPALEQDAWRP
ncbi:MAG: class I SAM-dependent methyltransferase [Phycisphaerae bacterium]|nr:class I SAM-dependent methyltransferase [Phycisphaerae bacterium]